MEIDRLTVGISVDGADHAAASVDKLTAAVERLNAALRKLPTDAHGGISIHVVGDLALADVKPGAGGVRTGVPPFMGAGG
jgi:predicted trehalose synthase